MNEFHVPPHEQGKTRLFSLSMPTEDARELQSDPVAQAEHLGVDKVKKGGVDVFCIADLGDLGLAGYLRDGLDIRGGDIQQDRARLHALNGWVMLVHSSAFEGSAVELRPDQHLTLIGTYTQENPDHIPTRMIAEAARPYTGIPDITPPQAPKGRAGAALVALGMIVLAVLIFWWALA